jgi:8-oxo-dGTP pyrophosphatase MutT (NUDIX family)
MHALLDHIRARLPDHKGAGAIERFAPSHTRGARFQLAPSDAREACVIALLYQRGDEWHVPLVLRTDLSTHHRGQVAFPGGAREPNERLQDTALRELNEEIGVPPSSVEILGQLTTFYVPVSRYQVHPWLGWAPVPPVFRPNPMEVAAILETPLRPILDLSNLACESREISGELSEIPYFTVEGHKVWGASCIVLGELAILCAGAPC